jgi:fatty acid synthase subunit alpha, fungi type
MLEMMTMNTLVKIKEAPPYSIELETRVLLNSLVRASPDKKTGSHTFKKSQPTEMKQNLANVKAIEETLKVSRSTARVGVDQGAFSVLSWELK